MITKRIARRNNESNGVDDTSFKLMTASGDITGETAHEGVGIVAGGGVGGTHSDPPLVRLTKLHPEDMKLNKKKLKYLLKNYGEYPEKYRLLIWRFLLQLPENIEAYQSLVMKGPHASTVSLSEQYPISDRR